MISVNENFLKIQANYLFSDIAKKVNKYMSAHPDSPLIRLGIGDVTRPLPQASIEAMHQAVDEMADSRTFRGYGPEQGYAFLAEAIRKNDYESRGVDLDVSEIFISDGAKSDTGNIGDILGRNNVVAVTDPVYPVYVDSNVMAGRAGDFMQGGWSNLIYMPCTPANQFVPALPANRIPDIIYLCYPNNPTGTTLSREELAKWVAYAQEHRSLILYDAAYEAYIQEENIPHSIYEIDGAKEVAIEFRSFSKTAGFTGVRCGYTVVPKEVKAYNEKGEAVALNALWNRRQSTKFNGTSYITQRAAEAIYTPQGKQQVQDTIAYYMHNAQVLREGLESCGMTVYGGKNAPYIWMQTPNRISSWTFFDSLLNELSLVTTPGVGFGPSGEGFIRLTAFGDKDKTVEAVQRLKAWL